MMNTIHPRPYPQNVGNYNTNHTGTDKDGHNQQGQERQQQNQGQNQEIVARGRAEQVTSQVQSYPQANNAYPQMTRPNYQTRIPQNSALAYQTRQINPQQYQTIQSNYQPIQSPAQPSPQTTPVQRRSNKVNIAQILKDFRNTMKAIATPADIEENVNKYLQIVEQQVHESNPQINLVQSNLKIAASMLDKYISETLNKESKVVQNWLDALFLQRINYNYDENEVNPSFSVQFSDNNKTEEKEEHKEEIENKNVEEEIIDTQNKAIIDNTTEIEEIGQENIEEEFSVAQKKIHNRPNVTIIPQDTRLKSLFMEAKKHAFSNNPQKAMAIFKEAFNRAEKLKDTETQSRICLEVGKIYDDNDFIVQALTSYHKSLLYTTDTNVKSKAHYSMAQIYDDVNEVETALKHYVTSISYAGNSDDLIGQTDSLTRIANIYTDKYNENAFEYYDVARKLIDQTDDSNMKGYVLSNTADACVQFRKNDKALKYYAEAVKNYEKTNSSEEIAENYKSAAELMISFNSPNKAKSLLKKAMVNAVKTQNEDLVSEINLLLSSLE